MRGVSGAAGGPRRRHRRFRRQRQPGRQALLQRPPTWPTSPWTSWATPQRSAGRSTTPARVLGLASTLRGRRRRRAAARFREPGRPGAAEHPASRVRIRGLRARLEPQRHRRHRRLRDDRESVVPEHALADAAGPVAAAAGGVVTTRRWPPLHHGGTVTPTPHGQEPATCSVRRRVRITYYDTPGHRRRPHRLPAGRRSLLGVARYQGTRPLASSRREPRRGRAGEPVDPTAKWTSPSPRRTSWHLNRHDGGSKWPRCWRPTTPWPMTRC